MTDLTTARGIVQAWRSLKRDRKMSASSERLAAAIASALQAQRADHTRAVEALEAQLNAALRKQDELAAVLIAKKIQPQRVLREDVFPTIRKKAQAAVWREAAQLYFEWNDMECEKEKGGKRGLEAMTQYVSKYGTRSLGKLFEARAAAEDK